MHPISLAHGEEAFRLSRLSGALHAVAVSNRSVQGLPSFGKKAAKITHAMAFCDEPYKFARATNHQDSTTARTWGCDHPCRAMNIAKQLVQICRRQFFLGCMTASFRKPLFDSSANAIAFFRNNVDGDQSTLCLPRALYAAKTSRRFKDEGVVFIGVFLPSRSMHAWVVEGDSLVDPADDIWINYQPVAVLA